LREQWPGIRIQRCTARKLRNQEAKARAALCEEVKEDYRRMVYAESCDAIAKARTTFRKT
jgi:hypothetical protein